MKGEIKNNIKKILESNNFKTFVYTLGVLFVIFLIFQVGMMAGFRKASFGRDWGDNYERNFGSPHRDPKMMGGELGDFGNLPNAHGAIGKIIKIELPTIIVLDEKDKTEKVVLINEKTEIRLMRDVMTSDKLKIDDHIIVIGAPNSSGQIEARLIRFLPAPLPAPINNLNQ
jgi:hypothetical protein